MKSSKKRRLAFTRGLSNLDRGTKSNSATPFNSPIRVPVISSTPISTSLVREAVPPPGISSLPVQLPPYPPYSPATAGGVSGPRGIVGQALPPTLPPISAADHSGPGAEGNTGSHRVSVISPRIFVSEAICGKDSAEPEPDPSLDWDNFRESPSYRLASATAGIKNLQITTSLEGTGLEDIRKITLYGYFFLTIIGY